MKYSKYCHQKLIQLMNFLVLSVPIILCGLYWSLSIHCRKSFQSLEQLSADMSISQNSLEPSNMLSLEARSASSKWTHQGTSAPGSKHCCLRSFPSCEHLLYVLSSRQRRNSFSKRSVWLPDLSHQLQVSGQPEVEWMFGQSYNRGQQPKFHSFIGNEELKTPFGQGQIIQEPSPFWKLFVEVYVMYVELEDLV